MTHVRRLLRDRAVLAGIGVLLVFAVASAGLTIWTSRVATSDQRAVDAAATQVRATHQLAAGALLLADGDQTQQGELLAALEVFERTHRGLRFGDRALGLAGVDGTDLELRFTAIEPTFAALTEAVRSGVAAPGAAATGAVVVERADAYRAQMSRIAGVLTAGANANAVRAQQLELGAVTVGFALAIMILMVAAHRKQATSNASGRAAAPSELDQLTGLVRRSALREHLIDAIHFRPATLGFVALLLIDVRPTTTHNGGAPRRAHDRAMQDAARRLRATVRSTDLLARTGRSRFAVVIDRSPRPDDAARVAEKLLDALRGTVATGPTTIDLVPAIGISLSPLDATTADDLLERAELALRIAAERPAPEYRYFSPNLRPDSASRVAMARALREAIGDGGQLSLAYQPKIRLADSAVVGFEALARWTHPELGEIAPDEFIAIAEESDLIIELGEWVIDSVCAQLAGWREQGHSPLPVSINVSTREFRHGDLDATVAAALERHGVVAELLEVEITEGVLIDDHEQPLRHMRDLQDLGVRIAVDDFGTGYSSLSYLKRFPIDTLKIDRSFVSELREGTEDAAIATAIIALAHSLGLHVIAEGVESREQLEILLTLGCDIAQGFYFGRPGPASEVHRMWPATLPGEQLRGATVRHLRR